ncbi:hypothetical protein MHIB_12430 [Mycolicibacter hiberniae]|uniref:Uncharacterized protein n=1 Tax=Mycolicibacter hiberniae TaxID=29314 RepID=A0A7I7X102_9MYCO|nr:hypothetical protein MHIB_12430 [Mycolicibacter hiberniae]
MQTGANDESVISTWAQRLKECGIVLDYLPELADAVVSGATTLNDASTCAVLARRSQRDPERKNRDAKRRTALR